jgi:hypothetical protein
MSNRTIAARPLVTKRTVEAHITQIFHELHPPQSADQHRRVLAVLADTPRLTRSVQREHSHGQARTGLHRSARTAGRTRSWDGLVQNPNG